MSYATLMVYVDVEGKPDGRVSVAADLARRFDAHLIGIASGASISVVLGEDAPNEAAAEMPHLRDMKALLDQKGQEFRAAVGTSGRRAEWRSVVGRQTDAVAREARAADLVIIGNARASRDPFRALDPGSFILKAGRPVLVVPTAVMALPPKRIAVAWKDVREARRAVQDALPFLQEAENVFIVEVSDRARHRARAACRRNCGELVAAVHRERKHQLGHRRRLRPLATGGMGIRRGHPRLVGGKSGLLPVLALTTAKD